MRTRVAMLATIVAATANVASAPLAADGARLGLTPAAQRATRSAEALAQQEWLRTHQSVAVETKVADGQTVSVISYPAAPNGLTCDDLRVAGVTMGPGCVPSNSLFASGPLTLHQGEYNAGVDLGLTWVWGNASSQVTTIDVRLANGRTVTVPIIDGTFLYAGSSGARPVAVTAKDRAGHTISTSAVQNFTKELENAKSRLNGRGV